MNNKRIQVSLYCASNRPRLWLWFYDTVKHNKLNFEIVFAGDVAPDYELPPNFRFVYTTVKVSQANFIAALECRGETLVHTGDDLQFIQPNALDLMYDFYKSLNNYKCMVWAKFGRSLETSGVVESQQTTQGVLMSRKLFFRAGGYDKRYYCNTYDVDLHYRILSKSVRGTYKVCDNVCIWHRDDLTDFEPKKRTSGWFKWNGQEDVDLLLRQWSKDYPKISYPKLRTSATPFQPFEVNDTLYTVSQGTSGSQWDEQHKGPMKKEAAGTYPLDIPKGPEYVLEWETTTKPESKQVYVGGIPPAIG